MSHPVRCVMPTRETTACSAGRPERVNRVMREVSGPEYAPSQPTIPDAPPAGTADSGEAIGSRCPCPDFAGPDSPTTPSRALIRAANRSPEPDCLPPLIAAAGTTPDEDATATDLARRLVAALRAEGPRGPVERLMREYSLSSAEGIALMCLAEALLRIPDDATRDALIGEKIGSADWRAHLGRADSLFVNATTWSLVVTGRVLAVGDGTGLSADLTRLCRRLGRPLLRRAVALAMRVLGSHFIAGRTIAEALDTSRRMEAKGFTYSYDMLGEAAMTADDAARYRDDYGRAIAAIGGAARGRGPFAGSGISVKLSALHPRYARAQRARVVAELLPRLAALARAASGQDIGFTIDAEEANRLDLSLDLIESLALDRRTTGWDGLGIVVQAYQKRAPFVLDFLIDLARRSGRRLMIRLVKGAYWDVEIKRAQVDGLDSFPVFTRKVHTDVSYLACARKLLAAPEAVFPQFATHNARTVAAIVAMAGPRFRQGDYEFQCLHGMGEGLYEQVVRGPMLDRPCRIYAPVGTHGSLLAYLVRRLLENGANASFVNRIGDPAEPMEALIADPKAQASAISPLGSGHPGIALPKDLFGARRANSRGLDLADEDVLADLGRSLAQDATTPKVCRPMLGVEGPTEPARLDRAVANPAAAGDVVGHVQDADDADVDAALAQSCAAAARWAAHPPAERAACLMRAAELMEARRNGLIGLLIREAGKMASNAVAEIREAVDFLRYYAEQSRGFAADTHRPLGPIACISPWNFPLAIFTGQVAAALAAGNTVLAKPAEETPLVAGVAVGILREAGIPPAVLQMLPGDGRVGARLVADPRVCGVIFTGSTEVARSIQATLSERLGPDGWPVPLIAETGGQNALVVDSSALPEQVVADVLTSAFDSAGQRCSALRVLCLQEEIADRVLDMLEGAMAELAVGNPGRLATDIGPVISAQARDRIETHVARMRGLGHPVHRRELPPGCEAGHFVPPTLVRLRDVGALEGEVFGPVLHVVRFPRDGLDAMVRAINAAGYGLTFGVHSRIDATVARLTESIHVGNLYVNRNLVGAVVGVQPFGGENLSGTGPKAGGPLYLRRLLSACPVESGLARVATAPAALAALRGSLLSSGRTTGVAHCDAALAGGLFGYATDLPGPTGEINRYSLHPRGRILCLPSSETGLVAQLAAALAGGNTVLLYASERLVDFVAALPEAVQAAVSWAPRLEASSCVAILVEGPSTAVLDALRIAAATPGAVIPVFGASSDGLTRGCERYASEWLLRERSLSIDTTAAGGNASLSTL